MISKQNSLHVYMIAALNSRELPIVRRGGVSAGSLAAGLSQEAV